MISALTIPRSVAVIGASARLTGLAGRPLDYLKRYGFDGDLHVVRPDGESVLGVPAVRSVADLPADVDLAVITIPAGPAIEAYAQCIDHGVKAAVMVASGFERGSKAERELRRQVARGGTRLIGPNCVGFLNSHEKVYATVASSFLELPALPGGVGIVTQSGGLGNAIVAALAARGLGISSWYSSGSEFDVGALDIIRSMIDDPNTRVITAFVEGLRDGHDLVCVGRHAQRAGKPVFVLKGGLSQAGQRSARLHTGKVSSGPLVWKDVADQAGITLVDSVEELVDAAAIAMRLPAGSRSAEGPRTVILSASGGLGVLLADRCQVLDLPLASLSKPIANMLAQTLRLPGKIGNPVDIGAASDAEVSTAVEHLVAEPGIDAVLLVASRIASKDYRALSTSLQEVRSRVGSQLDRLVVSFLGPADVVSETERQRLEPVALLVDSPFRAVSALRKVWRARQAMPRASRHTTPAVLARHSTALSYDWPTIQQLAGKYELPLVTSILARDERSAVQAAADIGLPVVMKVVAPALWHRTDRGLVRVGVSSLDAVGETFRELAADWRAQGMPGWDGILLQPVIPAGLEVIVGVRWDAELGPILSVGLGGTAVEVIAEVHHRQLPTARREISQLVRASRMGVLMAGLRGAPALDEEGLVAAAESAARLFALEPDVTELEMNPLIVTTSGVHGVDIKLATGPADTAGAR